MSFRLEVDFHSLRHILVQRKTGDGAAVLEKIHSLLGGYSALQTFSARGAAASFFFFDVSSLFNSQQECFPVVGAGEDSSAEITLAMSLNPYQVNRN